MSENFPKGTIRAYASRMPRCGFPQLVFTGSSMHSTSRNDCEIGKLLIVSGPTKRRLTIRCRFDWRQRVEIEAWWKQIDEELARQTVHRMLLVRTRIVL